MAQSYQNEIPKARINIQLDVETGGARKKKELPMKLLAVGDFSKGKTKGPIVERERINVNKNNFDKVLADLGPEVNMAVPNKIKNDDTDLRVSLNIKRLKDFHPEEVVKQVPELCRLLAMRNLLKDFRSNLLDNAELRRELERVAKDETAREQLQQRLKAIAPMQAQLAEAEEN